MRIRALVLVPVLLVPPAASRAGGHVVTPLEIQAGADAGNITPYTFVDAGHAGPGRPATSFVGDRQDAGGVPTSNPDGIAQGTIFDFLPDAVPHDGSCDDPVAWTGTITDTGVWGEPYTDVNANHRYDIGEPFVDDPQNSVLDYSSVAKYDGVYLAGFGADHIPFGAADPVTVRTLVLRAPTDSGAAETFAWVTLDLVGWLSDRVSAIREVLAHGYRITDVDHILLGTTHDHEAPDMIGIWGAPDVGYGLRDGKMPLYERYVIRKVAQSICKALARAAPAAFAFGTITPADGDFTTYKPGDALGAPSGVADGLGISGLQTRNSCRTPWSFDDQLRVMRVVRAGADQATREATIATVTNFGVHVESLEDGNDYVSSDFSHGVRTLLESVVGGVAMHTPGAQGAVEIVGDSCSGPNRQGTRVRFDGTDYGNPDGSGVQYGPARTYALGRVLASGALRALERAPVETPATIDFRARDVHVHVTNGLLAALSATGSIDRTAEINETETVPYHGVGTDVRTAVYAFRIGSGSFVTSPGELFPELYFGVATHNRMTPDDAYYPATAEYVECSRQAETDAATGRLYRPYEPSILDAQRATYDAAHNWLIGYTPDLLGYIVPGYDFMVYGVPAASGAGQPLLGIVAEQNDEVEVPDPCAGTQVSTTYAPGARFGRHYHEIVSASSMLAPSLVCETVDMLRPTDDVYTTNEACAQWAAWKDLPARLHNPLDYIDPMRVQEQVISGDLQGLFVRRY
jgi:hypothetical protein